jgi:hypothetical protein
LDQLWGYPHLIEAQHLGLKLAPNWKPNDIEIIRYKDNYPLFVIVGAEISDGYVNAVFYKKSKTDTMKYAFEHGHPGFGIVFSPSGKQVLFQDYWCAMNEESFILPTSAFDKIDEHKNEEGGKYGLVFHGTFWGQAFKFEPYIKHAIGGIDRCVHLMITGVEWLDETHVKTNVFANYCNIGGKLNPDGDEMECIIDITNGKVNGLKKI